MVTAPDAGARYRVLLLGGYGFFGTLLARRLARQAALHVVIAGRDAARAQAAAAALSASAAASFSAAAIDMTSPGLADAIAAQGARAVVHTAGPFQGQDYSVAAACIAAGTHYIDLADGRDFVTGIVRLHAAAVSGDVLVASGASSVPALSGAVVDHLTTDFATVRSIDIGISPGNRTERGLATMQAILSYCGAPITSWRHGRPASVYGWQGLRLHRFPAPVGVRWLGHCDVPDLALLPQRYPGIDRVEFRAGLELAFLQAGMWLMASARHCGLVRDWAPHAAALLRAGRWFMRFGSDAGAMHVTVAGMDRTGRVRQRTWTLIAERGDGPYVPTLAAAALIGRLARGDVVQRGAVPCLGLLSLDDFAPVMDGLAIATRIDDA